MTKVTAARAGRSNTQSGKGRKYDDLSERGGGSQHDIKVSECHKDGTNPAAWRHAADSFNMKYGEGVRLK